MLRDPSDVFAAEDWAELFDTQEEADDFLDFLAPGDGYDDDDDDTGSDAHADDVARAWDRLGAWGVDDA